MVKMYGLEVWFRSWDRSVSRGMVQKLGQERAAIEGAEHRILKAR